ncbi:hypothetical protein NXY42_21190 [Bacteroides fragilis]|nr:hypothetical protein [Bacteroides fragilis]
MLHPQAAARAVGDGAQQALFRVVEADAQAVAVGHALEQAHGIVLLAREAVVEVPRPCPTRSSRRPVPDGLPCARRG